METKVCTLKEAVSMIPSGSVVGVGGNSNYRRPLKICLEIIQQRKKDLTLLSMTAGLSCDLLVGAGCASTIRTSYFGLEVFGLAPMFRRAAEKGVVKIIEETETTIAAGMKATLAQLPFLPARALQGTDILKVRPDIRTVLCPYTGEKLSALPAIRPDVAIIHALASDEEGNLLLGGNLSIDIELAQIADLTIATIEKLVSHQEILACGADIIGMNVHKVVLAPRGAYPTSCYPEYQLDGLMFIRYIEACQENRFWSFVDDLNCSSE